MNCEHQWQDEFIKGDDYTLGVRRYCILCNLDWEEYVDEMVASSPERR